MRNFKIGSGEAAMRFNGDDESAAITWNGTESYSITAGGLRLRNVATASLPADPPDGTMVYDTTAQVVKVWDGSAWNAVGNAIAAGSGIDFSANTGTAATGATTTSELFDWYEEGTWTPNLWDNTGSSSEGQTYSPNLGWFTRTGREVSVSAVMVVTSLGTLSGGEPLRIGPLPYNTTSTSGYQTAFTATVSGLAAGLVSDALIISNVDSIYLYVTVTSTGVFRNMVLADVSAPVTINVSGKYIT